MTALAGDATPPQKVLVTGGAGELGIAIARGLLARGVRVALLDIAPETPKIAESLSHDGTGGTVVGIVSDVSGDEVEGAVVQAVDRLGGLDGLVHAAGVGGNGRTLVDSQMADVRRIVDIDLVGTFSVTRAVARSLLQRETRGALVLIGSIFGQRGLIGSTAYGAAKAGITHLTESLALELAPHGVRVNAIAPGNMASELHWTALRKRAVREGRSFEELVTEVRERIPLGRHGTGEDVASAAYWLLSTEASYVTGQTLIVDGGALLA